MSSWHAQLPPSPVLDELAAAVDADPRVLSVVLTGSWARDMATPHSDIDLFLIVERGDLEWTRTTRAGIDVQTVVLDRLRRVPSDPSRWWDRYSYCRTKVLLDRSEGAVPRLLDMWSQLSDTEIVAAIDFHIEGYLHYLYRSLKGMRDQQTYAARLDAAESLPWALSLLFAVNGRVRPSNKYVQWELERHPIAGEGWEAERVLDLLRQVLDTGAPTAQRALFALIEPRARAHGFGGVIDSFRGVSLLRG